MNGYSAGYIQTHQSNPVASAVGGLIELVVVIAFIVAFWKVFEKAGQAGWKSIIPFYNAYIILKIAGKPGWWLILFFIPLVNIVIAFITYIAIAKMFGRSALFGFFLLTLFPIGWFIVAFGSDTYKGTKSSSSKSK